jgi:competence protein ComEA
MQSRVKGVRDGNSAKFSADGLTVGGTPFKAAPIDAAAKPAKASKASKADGAKK